MRLNRVYEYCNVEIGGSLPERIKIEFTEVCAFDIRCDDGADGAELLDGMIKFCRRFLGMRQRHRSEHGKSAVVCCAEIGQVLIQEAMPLLCLRPRQPIGKDVGPGREHLPVNSLPRHGIKPLGDRLDQLGKKRPDLEAVVEMKGAGTGSRMPND